MAPIIAELNTTIERLRLLRAMEQAAPVGYGFRFYLDRIIGGHKFYEGALPTNWQSTPKKLRKLILQSVAVRELTMTRRPEKELGKLILLEHAYTMRELRELVMAERYQEAIDAYDVRFVTRNEDALLKQAEAAGYQHAARYAAAEIKF
jgi:hypothetical protein